MTTHPEAEQLRAHDAALESVTGFPADPAVDFTTELSAEVAADLAADLGANAAEVVAEHGADLAADLARILPRDGSTPAYTPSATHATGRQRWQERYNAALAAGAVRDADFTTLSGEQVEPCYGPSEAQEAADPDFARIGWPGEYPFTRGLHSTGFRGRTWTIRQFAGFGNAEQTNERYRMILERGGGGLSDIDLGTVTTSMTISGPAVPVFCMYLVAAERQGVDVGVLNGTLQTDIFKEYIAQKEWLFEPEPHLRLIGDLMEYCDGRIRNYKPLSVSGYHIREAGATAAQELAFTLADGFGYVELGLSRGLDIDSFAPGLSFFFDAHLDFFEEIAKFRAARRIWARWMRDVYHARTEKAQRLRFHTQTAGVSLTAQQPLNNVVRTAVEALAAIFGGTNSLHTNALDETLALPTAQSAEVALRTQQVLMEETGVVNVADPLGGSWYVEALTDRIETEAEAIFDRIRRLGETGRTPDADGRLGHEIGPMTSGLLRGIEEGWFTSEIGDAAFTYQLALERGDKKVVGVNCHTASQSHELEILRVSHEVEAEQVRVLAARKTRRDDAAVAGNLAHLAQVSRTDENMIPAMLDAVRAEATLGEICGVLKAQWGVYREPASF